MGNRIPISWTWVEGYAHRQPIPDRVDDTYLPTARLFPYRNGAYTLAVMHGARWYGFVKIEATGFNSVREWMQARDAGRLGESGQSRLQAGA